MDYANFALYGFAILFIIYLYYLSLNIKKNSYIIFGSFLVTIGYFFAAMEKYNHIKNPHHKNPISKSHLILGAFLLLSFLFPINHHSKKTDIFGLVGHFILINTNFGYNQIANVCLTIYYLLYTYRNGMDHETIGKIRAFAGGSILLYYIKQTIDNFYNIKEKKLKDKKIH